MTNDEFKEQKAHLLQKIADCRVVLAACNEQIESGMMVPNPLQQAQLAAIAEMGRKASVELQILRRAPFGS